jgi:hypothetical protein
VPRLLVVATLPPNDGDVTNPYASCIGAWACPGPEITVGVAVEAAAVRNGE